MLLLLTPQENPLPVKPIWNSVSAVEAPNLRKRSAVAWTLLVLPWVLASRSAAHWLIWLVIAYAAANLYTYQVLIFSDRLSPTELNCILSMAFAVGWAPA